MTCRYTLAQLVHASARGRQLQCRRRDTVCGAQACGRSRTCSLCLVRAFAERSEPQAFGYLSESGACVLLRSSGGRESGRVRTGPSVTAHLPSTGLFEAGRVRRYSGLRTEEGKYGRGPSPLTQCFAPRCCDARHGPIARLHRNRNSYRKFSQGQ